MLNLESWTRENLEKIIHQDTCLFAECRDCPLEIFGGCEYGSDVGEIAREFLEAIDEHNAKQGAQND